MDPISEFKHLSRRDFLTSTAGGLGMLAMTSLLKSENLLTTRTDAAALTDPLAAKPSHMAPKATNCIFILMAGAPSQIDLFDPKPKLLELDGDPLPESLIEKVRFAFIQKESARLMGSPRKFKRHGQCGMELSDLLPHIGSQADDICLIRSMHTEAFNHHPGQLMINTGLPIVGHPAMGSWLTYGLGSASKNLPGYVVLSSGRGASAGAANWTSGFLPSCYAGVPFRGQGDPILNLSNPSGLSEQAQRHSLDAIRELNNIHYQKIKAPEIASRTAAYELAFRMQSAAPELTDLSAESQETLDMYGLEREDPKIKAGRGGGVGQYHAFAKNCLLARRLVERDVRFVNLIHATWDHHSNLDTELTFNAGMCDQPIAALIKDLKQRGLFGNTLVVWACEFGRTPLGENRKGRPGVTGRDHHPFAFSMWLAGAGVKGGQVIGKTDEVGWNIVENPIHINDFHATILHLFGLDHEKLTYRFKGRDFRLTDVAGNVVREIIA